MRDIRNDLRERLAAVSGRYAEQMGDYNRKLESLQEGHKQTIAMLERERATLELMLKIEEQQQRGVPDIGEAKKTPKLVALTDLVFAR